MWTAIKADATTKSQLHKVDTRRRLMMARCEEDGEMKSHLNGMTWLRDELVGMGVTVSDEDFSTILLTSLPSSYRVVMSSIIHSASLSKTKVELNDILRIVLEEAQQRSFSKQSGKPSETALVAGGNSGQSRRNKGEGKAPANQQKSDKKCENCKQTNHNTPDCFQKGGAKEGQAPWQKNKPAGTETAIVAKVEPEEKLFSFVCTSDYAHIAKRENTQQTERDAAMDSGASAHFCPDRSMFRSFREIESSPVTAADGHVFKATGCSDIVLRVPNGPTTTDLVLEDAAYALSMVFTLISVGQLDKRGYTLTFSDLQCTLRDPETQRIVARLPWVNGLYRAQRCHPNHLYASIAVRKLTLAEAHRVLGHINYGSVKHAIRTGLVMGLELDETSVEEFCEPCVMAKSHRKPFPDKAQNRATEYGERGPMGPSTSRESREE
jgi:hypothetical protein